MLLTVIIITILLVALKSTQYVSLRLLFKEYGHKPSNNIIVQISVVVALKNEEHNVNQLVLSLAQQNYPKDKFEIIFVDDNSTDKTYELLKALTQNEPNVKLIKAAHKNFPAKKGALAIGVSAALYPYILLTDGDCFPEKEWIASFTTMFTKGYDLIVGIAPYYQKKNFLNSMICFENLMNTMLTSSFLSLKIPYAAAGRSIGYTKSAYVSVKGYENTMDTVSGDDDLFIREAVKKNLNVGFVSIPQSFVYSHAPETLPAYLNQRVRHLKTSHYYPFSTQSVLFIWHEITYISQYFFLLFFISPVAVPLSALKILFDIIMVRSFQKKFGYRFSIIQIALLSFSYELFVLIHILNSTMSKTKWK